MRYESNKLDPLAKAMEENKARKKTHSTFYSQQCWDRRELPLGQTEDVKEKLTFSPKKYFLGKFHFYESIPFMYFLNKLI